MPFKEKKRAVRNLCGNVPPRRRMPSPYVHNSPLTNVAASRGWCEEYPGRTSPTVAAVASGKAAANGTPPVTVTVAPGHVTPRDGEIAAHVHHRDQLLARVQKGEVETQTTYDEKQNELYPHVLAWVQRVGRKKAEEAQSNYRPKSNAINPVLVAAARTSLPTSSSRRSDESTNYRFDMSAWPSGDGARGKQKRAKAVHGQAAPMRYMYSPTYSKMGVGPPLKVAGITVPETPLSKCGKKLPEEERGPDKKVVAGDREQRTQEMLVYGETYYSGDGDTISSGLHTTKADNGVWYSRERMIYGDNISESDGDRSDTSSQQDDNTENKCFTCNEGGGKRRSSLFIFSYLCIHASSSACA